MTIEKIWSYAYELLGDLTLPHFEHLTEGSGLTPEILRVARPFSLNGRFVREVDLRNEILDRLNLPRGYEHDLLIFPYPGYGDVFRVRLDVPEMDKEGHSIRYKQPAKQRNLPYIIKPIAPRYSQLFITEGEKKALALVQAGCPAIAFGGVWNWRDRASPTGVIPDMEDYELKDRTIVIAFDSDIHSNRHVQQAEEALVNFCLDRGARKVLRLRLPSSSGEKIGIDDFLKDWGWHELDPLLVTALVDEGFLDGAEVRKASYQPTSMLTGFFPSRGLVLVAGVPGCGKTEFLIHQAIQAAASGEVLYFLNEGGPHNLQQRQNAYCQDDQTLKRLRWCPWRGLILSDPDGLIRFERILKTFRPKAVFVDPGPDAFGEENDAAALKEPLRRIYQLAEKYDACIVLSWHFSKMPSFSGVYSFRGSSAIAGKVDLVYDITLSEKRRILKLDKLRLDCEGLRQGQRWIIQMEKGESGRELKFLDMDTLAAEQNERKQAALDQALAQFTPGETYPAPTIIEAIVTASEGGVSEDTARRYLRELVKKGYFVLEKKGRGTTPAQYRRAERPPGEEG